MLRSLGVVEDTIGSTGPVQIRRIPLEIDSLDMKNSTLQKQRDEVTEKILAHIFVATREVGAVSSNIRCSS